MMGLIMLLLRSSYLQADDTYMPLSMMNHDNDYDDDDDNDNDDDRDYNESNHNESKTSGSKTSSSFFESFGDEYISDGCSDDDYSDCSSVLVKPSCDVSLGQNMQGYIEQYTIENGEIKKKDDTFNTAASSSFID
eukprot:CAMPEP_0194151384 /NCGR_PEP_ID=MMETSP0152-20130528/47904_1 /TAXON_ID=1049557 /ORGANISM="Thalassiothrix antarctica, Strain L6-D1" /LENGTH=134 /DNA_ID=CAMNT_0038855149 /DNA_START=282 /DNA_END=686 /DNA_ORIENTATION=-